MVKNKMSSEIILLMYIKSRVGASNLSWYDIHRKRNI